MNIIDKSSLLTPQQIQCMRQNASLPFHLESYFSLDDILTGLGDNVFIEPGIKYRIEHPKSRKTLNSLDKIEGHWRKELERLEKEISEKHDDKTMKEFGETRSKWERIQIDKKFYLSMRIRGLYNPRTNTITLFYKEMMQEFGGAYMEELLVSTLAHETMHAYFNRPDHKSFPYLYFVEEPLAEFGMLLWLYEIQSNFYSWAYADVKNKRTCYCYGADLMDQHTKEGPTFPTRDYLEAYKIQLDENHILTPNNNRIVLPTKSKTKPNSKSTSVTVTINGQKIQSTWKNLVNLPTYYWDDKTQTLGLNGDWIDAFCGRQSYNLLHDLEIRRINNLYLGDCFRTDGLGFPTPISDLRNTLVTVDPSNPFCKIVNGIAMYNDGSLLPIYKSCGRGLYVIPQNDKWGIWDNRLGKIVVPCQYDSIWSFDENGLCMVRKDDAGGYRYGYVNKQGQEQIPVVYEHIYRFENGVTTAKMSGSYGIIEENNNIVHPFNLQYPDMRGIRNGYATMKDHNGKWGAIDARGNVVIPCQYDSLVIFNDEGIAEVKKDGKEFKIDIKGDVI